MRRSALTLVPRLIRSLSSTPPTLRPDPPRSAGQSPSPIPSFSSLVDYMADSAAASSSSPSSSRPEQQHMHRIRFDSPFPPWEFSPSARYPTRRPRRISARLGPPRREALRSDPFHQLSLNPLHEIHNVPLLSQYVSEMGKILPRSETKLTWRSQRLVGKAIRRARAMGLMPIMARADSWWRKSNVSTGLNTMQYGLQQGEEAGAMGPGRIAQMLEESARAGRKSARVDEGEERGLDIRDETLEDEDTDGDGDEDEDDGEGPPRPVRRSFVTTSI